MATKITKICDICNREYSERDYLLTNFGNSQKKTICHYKGELQFRYSTNDPILGDNTIRMFDYDLCPQCTSYYINKLKILP